MHFRSVGFLLLTFLVTGPVAEAQITNPSSASDPERDNIETAHKLIAEARYGDALRQLQQIQSRSPNTKRLQHELGVAYYHTGDLVAAVAALQKALLEVPDDHEAQQLLGMSYFQLGKPSEAIPLLEKVKTWLPAGNVDVSYSLGLCYIHTRNYDGARRSFAAMYGIAPQSAPAFLFAARMMLRQGYDPIAEQYAQKAVSLDSQLPLAHFLLGEFYLYKSKLAEAGEEFEKEIKLNPAYAASYERLADTYVRMTKYDQAEPLLKRAILLDMTSTGPYILMGKVHVKKQDYSQAATYLERAIKMDPNNYISHHLLGEAYRGMGRAEAAERELKLAEQLQSSRHPQLENVR